MSRHSLPQLKDQTLLCLVISLIEVEHLLKTSNKRTQCKLELDKKKPTQSCRVEQHMTLAKISLYCILTQEGLYLLLKLATTE